MTPAEALSRTGAFATRARLLRRLRQTPVRDTWLVTRGTERFVLHVDGACARPLGLDRAREFRLQQRAAEARVAPPPVLLRPAAPAILVTRWAPGHNWDAASLGSTRGLTELAALLRELHAISVPKAEADDLAACIDRYERLAGSADASRLARSARALQAGLDRPAQPRLCHRDPLPANLVGRRQMQLIDWEYAGPGDPLFDLAAVASALSVSARDRFLRQWGGELDREGFARNARLYELVGQLWAAALRNVMRVTKPS